jgi:hypothetical protein
MKGSSAVRTMSRRLASQSVGADDNVLTPDTHEQLSTAVRLVSEAAVRLSDGQPRLLEWRKWSAGVLGGLYYSKTAWRAAETAFVELDACREGSPLVPVAKAAALVATGVAYAATRNAGIARAHFAAAKSLLESEE